ncbi:MAG: MBL fold metallo-hydrolase [Firmicutes bacterium]|nr:MBL fold metallo-hydrolase [[Eubacterium] siraeum]MCM1487234.1 MBL fold metallo-hydrolase [Bacillota bacterium]
MKTNYGLKKHRKRNNKAIHYAAVGRNRSSGTVKAVVTTVVVLTALFLLFFFLNDSFFEIDGIPTWDDLYKQTGLSADTEETEEAAAVHFIDVGQGDCQLIRSNGSSALIDCGEKDRFSDVIAYLKAQKTERLDYVIVTHPHSDHAGGMSYILDEFDIGTVIMPDIPDDLIPITSTYTRLLKSIERNNISLEYAKAGTEYSLGKGTLKLLSPVNSYDNLNNYSVTVRFDYINASFLFTGDIEAEAETDIIDSGARLNADVLKVAHHGSYTSSQQEFLNAAAPKYAVIEVGSPNDYGHPNEKTLSRLENMNVEIYRTDLHGSTVFVTDGEKYSITTEKEF